MAGQTILITGANGQLGQEFESLSANFPQYRFVFASRQELPIEDASAISTIFNSVKPNICINCAAYTAVDKAESEREQAFLVNADAVGHLANACKKVGAKLVHISTDYVFDGQSSRPWKEDDPTHPINVYGESKRAGEILAMQNNPATIIIRTSWVYSSFGKNFVKTMIRLMKEREMVKVVDDQIGSPTYAADLARVIMKVIKAENFIPGIFHYSNEGRISWYEFAIAIKRLVRSDCKVEPIRSSEYPTPARRPNYSLLDKTRISTVYGIHIPDWKDSLSLCIEELRKRKV
ncbi:MAG: dTDP-4-dehydrorhamnose reductase [Bacteroidetes bacterium]|nr:MAG: dTDP-4-dehydrorhamnose reductase [Bacteroidota bacterium]